MVWKNKNLSVRVYVRHIAENTEAVSYAGNMHVNGRYVDHYFSSDSLIASEQLYRRFRKLRYALFEHD